MSHDISDKKPDLPNSVSTSQPSGTVVLFGEMLADVFAERSVLGGAPFNVSRHLKAFGLEPVLITRLGNDALSNEMLQAMLQNGMQTIGIQRDQTHPTGQVQVRIEKGEPRFDILPMQAYDFIDPASACATALAVQPSLIYFGTLAQRHEVSGSALETLLQHTGGDKFLDINLRAPWYDEKTISLSLHYADIVKINDQELDLLARMFDIIAGKVQDVALELANRFDIAQIIVTCGAEGSWLLSRDGGVIQADIPDKLDSLVDTVGAGDGFASVCILGTLRRWPVDTTMQRANAFAAAICGIRGAVPDSSEFYDPFISEWSL